MTHLSNTKGKFSVYVLTVVRWRGYGVCNVPYSLSSAFLDSSHDQCGERFTDAEAHSGLGRACNMKVCVVVSKSRLWEHILLFNSWPSRCPSCPSSPPSFNHTFRLRDAFKIWNEFFSFLLVQIEQRKASKAPKNIFSKKWKENTFFRCSSSLHCGSSDVGSHQLKLSLCRESPVVVPSGCCKYTRIYIWVYSGCL